MFNRSIKLAFLFEIIIASAVFRSIASGQWIGAAFALLAAICIAIPFIITHIANMKKILLPSSFQLVTLVFVFLAQYLGEIKKFYSVFWWWDLLLHFIFGGYAVIIGVHMINGVITKEHRISKERFSLFSVIFAFCFSITLGTLWEIFEYAGDYLLKTNMVKGGLEDTITDLLVKISAAIITATIYYHRNLKGEHG